MCTSTTRPASPYEGQAIYETDTDKFLIYSGTAWNPPWNTAWGLVARSSITSNASINNGEGTITDVTFTAVANRYYKATLFAAELSNANASVNVFKIRQTSTTGTVLATSTLYTVAGDQTPMNISVVTTLSAGSQTLYARANNNAATSTTIVASSTQPSYFIVEDIGPA